jgi:hypothetical protein
LLKKTKNFYFILRYLKINHFNYFRIIIQIFNKHLRIKIAKVVIIFSKKKVLIVKMLILSFWLKNIKILNKEDRTLLMSKVFNP